MERRNIHNIGYNDIFVVRYGGINVFLKVVKTYEFSVAVVELETYKIKETNKFFNKWKKENPGKKVSSTGWAEILKKDNRNRKSGSCHLVPMTSKNNINKAEYTLRTGMYQQKPVLYVPINRKIRLWWEVNKLTGKVSEGLIRANLVVSGNESYKEWRKKMYIFYPYIPEDKSLPVYEA